MNILLWVLQILLALHTAVGALWKFSNPPESTPSLGAIPGAVWIALSVVELLCSVGLVLPALWKDRAIAAPIAATVIAAEMLLFMAVHLSSGATDHGPLIYWLVVAAVCGVVAYGRFTLRP